MPVGFRARWLPVLAMVLVGALYGVIALTAESELGAVEAKDAYYNLMVRGWTQGKVSLAIEAPAGLKALLNPYDPVANTPYRGTNYYVQRVHDLSYYQGKLYAYFSAVPAVVAFLPFRALTGGWLSHAAACFLFCLAGYIAGSILLWQLRDRFFRGTGDVALAVALLAVGILMVTPVLLERPDVWEVPITCAHAGWMITLLVVGRSLLQERASWVLGVAGCTAAAVAIGSRPSTAFGAVILLLPLARLIVRRDVTWLRRSLVVASFALPFAVVGTGLLAFNHARFGDWREFGQKYQLNGEHDRKASARYFQLAFLPYNARAYFFSAYTLGGEFPFVQSQDAPMPPWGHAGKDYPFGLLPHAPAILFALVPVLAWRRWLGPERRPLLLAMGAMAWMAFAIGGPLLLFVGACVRYQFEFTAPLALLAGLGFLTGEGVSAGARRQALRGLWTVLLAVSVAFSLCFAMYLRASRLIVFARFDEQRPNTPRAIAHLETALRLDPRLRAWRSELARLLAATWKMDAAAQQYARLIREGPADAMAHANYGYVLLQLGRWDEANRMIARALELDPGLASAKSLLDELQKRAAARK